MTKTPEMTKVLEDVSDMLEAMVRERTYQLRLEIDTLNKKLEKEQKENTILYSDRNEAFKLWDENKYKVFLAIEALESLLNSWNTNGDFYDYIVTDTLKKLKDNE